MTGEMFQGQRLEAHLAMLASTPHGFSLGHFVWQSCNEEKACLAPSLRRTSGDATAYVFVDNLGVICDNVGLSQ